MFAESEETVESFQKLKSSLDDWGLYGAIEGQPDIVEDFSVWELTNYTQLPYPGGWRDQPPWVRHDFTMLLKVKRFWKFNNTLSDANSLPSIEDM